MLEFGTEVSDEPEAGPIPFAVTAYSLSKGKTVRETFNARGEVPTSWLTLGRVIGENIVTTGQEIRDFIARVILDEDRERFLAFVDDPDHRTEASILQKIFEGLQGEYLNAGNPTARPTNSADGSRPRRTRSGGTTTARRSSKASTSSGSLAAVR